MPSLTAAAIIALLIAAALFLMHEIGKFVGEKRATDKFPEAKKAAVQRSRSVLGGMFAEQLAHYLPNFPFSPTEANRSTFSSSRAWTRSASRKSSSSK